MTYAEKLRDPRWQKKRLEIMQRDGFRCVSCLSDIDTLHIHHLRYQFGLNPWEYDNDFLVTLCESCHSGHEQLKYNLAQYFTRANPEVVAELLRAIFSASRRRNDFQHGRCNLNSLIEQIATSLNAGEFDNSKS